MFMSNGVLEAPKGYLKLVCEKVQSNGGLYIADEVQSGYGRTGEAFWGFEYHGVSPDLVTIGKPAGNGHPIGNANTVAMSVFELFASRCRHLQKEPNRQVQRAVWLLFDLWWKQRLGSCWNRCHRRDREKRKTKREEIA